MCFEFLNALMHLLNGRRLPLNDRSLLRNPFTQPLQLVVRVFWRIGLGRAVQAWGHRYARSLLLALYIH